MTRTTVNKRISSLLKELRLTALSESFEETTKHAEKSEMGHREYLLQLLEAESFSRRNKQIGRYLRESKIPLEKSMETFDMKRLPLKTRRMIETLVDGDFLALKENVLVFGNPGSGKTHLLCAIAHELIFRGHRVFFSSANKLVEILLQAKRELKLEAAFRKYSRYEAVILDDIGYVQYTREEMEVLFCFLAQRYERGSVMLTSNLPFSGWEVIFKDPMTTAAAIDRLVHHSIILELNIESYRMAAAKKKKRSVLDENETAKNMGDLD